ncbi:MAG: hypothetical protein HYX34_09385 [Actinobacteria bacterium]|nr:hypothetical protein [Actinomycetota bacterium]
MPPSALSDAPPDPARADGGGDANRGNRVPAPRGGGHRRFGRIALITVALATLAYWVFVFMGGGVGKNPDYLSDRAWVRGAERTCRAARTRIDALPRASTTPTKETRASVIERADAELRAMVRRLGTRVPSGSDGTVVRAWLKDYANYVRDREDYVRRLRANGRARFFVTDRSGKPVDEVIDDFASMNEMRSCMTPGDVG